MVELEPAEANGWGEAALIACGDEVAEAKATQVMDYARQNEHPLQLQIEKD